MAATILSNLEMYWQADMRCFENLDGEFTALCGWQKIQDAFAQYDEHGVLQSRYKIFELGVLQHIQQTDTSHPGRKHVPNLLDHFTHAGPHGEHVCLVFKVMGQSIANFRGQWNPPMIPVPMLQRIMTQTLQALDYLHHSCGIIHTDISPQNILTALPAGEEEDWIHAYLAKWPTAVGVSYSDYDYVKSVPINPPIHEVAALDIQLADLGAASWKHKHLTEWIQPNALRAPEVLIQAPWCESVDIWNLGLIANELLEARIMLHGELPSQSDPEYNPASHLAEIQGVFGKLPHELINQGRDSNEYFDTNGNLLLQPNFGYIPFSTRIRESDLPPVGKEDFIDFFCSMMQVSPEKRKTARDLLEHPWLRKQYKSRHEESSSPT
ncbi:MAG: hypothetical protein Q9170_004509 [Blastenia crenularia]